ncbi:hypothetical protein HYDPIDRAFT_104747 [Hydnomerulius pinastri MD-312]|nr:hypothetical protein HYDPIDRAFT_104747 [Hydnomerulius pinastri MD-312]
MAGIPSSPHGSIDLIFPLRLRDHEFNISPPALRSEGHCTKYAEVLLTCEFMNDVCLLLSAMT